MAKLPIKANVLYFGIALILAVLTTVLLGKFIQSKNSAVSTAQKDAIELTTVVVAKHALEAGHIIEGKDLTTVEWPTKHLPDADEYHTKLTELVDRVVQSPMVAHEPILNAKLAKTDSLGGLPVIIPPGKRAVTVGVSEIKGVAGFIHPGNWVDVLATFENGGNSQMNQTTHTVLQNVQVLAIAQDIHPPKEGGLIPTGDDDEFNVDIGEIDDDLDEDKDKEKEKPKKKKRRKSKKGELTSEYAKLVTSVTLALTPEEAQKIILADEAGNLRMILRNEEDRDVVAQGGTHISEILTGRKTTASQNTPQSSAAATPRTSAPRKSPSWNTVEFYDGTERSTLEF